MAKLDLAFLVDATRSMKPAMPLVKNSIVSMVDRIVQNYAECKLRVAFVSYLDYEHSPCKEYDFTPDLVSFNQFLSTVRAVSEGGEDTAEDVFSGLERVANLSWEASNRVLIHIADAPCHGLQFHDGVGDRYPDGDRQRRDIGVLLRSLHCGCEISTYYFCHVNDTTMKMVRKFEEVVPGGGWIQEQMFEDIEVVAHNVAALCINTVVCHNVSVLHVGQPKVRPRFPDWSKIPPRKAYQFVHKRESLDVVLQNLAAGRRWRVTRMEESIQVRIAPHPFSGDGSSRWPFFALVKSQTEEGSEEDSDEGDVVVLKRFKKEYKDDRKKEQARYEEQMEVQSVAALMARKFNRLLRNYEGAKRVKFFTVTTLKVRPERGASEEPRFYNMEEHLEGSWIRYSNNDGYVNTKDYAATLQAFSHWTHERSQGYLMVTDLQGVRNPDSRDNKFLLCDPAIHTKDCKRFSNTNLGLLGFQRFYQTHTCNNVCRALQLKVGMNGYTSAGTVLR